MKKGLQTASSGLSGVYISGLPPRPGYDVPSVSPLRCLHAIMITNIHEFSLEVVEKFK